jgi:hypothetical protein
MATKGCIGAYTNTWYSQLRGGRTSESEHEWECTTWKLEDFLFGTYSLSAFYMADIPNYTRSTSIRVNAMTMRVTGTDANGKPDYNLSYLGATTVGGYGTKAGNFGNAVDGSTKITFPTPLVLTYNTRYALVLRITYTNTGCRGNCCNETVTGLGLKTYYGSIGGATAPTAAQWYAQIGGNGSVDVNANNLYAQIEYIDVDGRNSNNKRHTAFLVSKRMYPIEKRVYPILP